RQRLWAALSPAARAFLVVVGTAALVGGALVWQREQAVEREVRQRVVLESSIGVWSSSTFPPGGSVHYFVRVRNAGPRPVVIGSLDASAGGLRLRLRSSAEHRLAAGAEIALPLSARLTCGAAPGAAQRSRLRPELTVGNEDGGSVVRSVEPGAAESLLDAVDPLCRVRPALVDHELSGPVRTGP
ncbi:MAG: hypothetical protein ACLGI3_10750, partial [Actinomycetes bacterium]